MVDTMILNQWYAIAPSGILKANEVKGLRRCGLDLALFRDSHGELGCVVDRCSHRYASLSIGKVKGDCLQCPFHGIEFDKKGECTLVPATGKAFKKNNSRFNLQHYAVREAHGIIYLFYGKAEDAKEALPFFKDLEDSMVYSEFPDHWESHYSRSIENQLDVIHLPFIHHNTIGRGNKTLVNGPKVEFVDNVLRTSASNALDIGQEPKRADECEINDHLHLRFMFPNLWMNHISDKIRVVIYFAPVDDDSTILYLRFYSMISKLRFVNQIIAFSGIYANRMIERQDKRVVITQNPKISEMRGGEKLLPGDGPIFEYRKLRKALQDQAIAETGNQGISL